MRLGFSQYKGLDSIVYMDSVRVDYKPSDRVEKNKNILDYIYAADPRTGLPAGCLSHYLSDTTRPEIKQFIEDYLLKNVPEQSVLSFPAEVSQHIKDLDDNFVFECMQGQYETSEMYRDRITQYMRELGESENNKKWLKSFSDKIKKNDES